MVIQKSTGISYTLYVMLLITLLLIVGTTMYFSWSPDRNKTSVILNGPWKFIAGDSMQYAQPNYDDSRWETVDLTAPSGAHDDDVGLSGFVPGWTSRGHSNYSGYAWYRLKVSLDSLTEKDVALTAPPAVDNAYQLFINGVHWGDGGADFSGPTPIAYSVQPRMFLISEKAGQETNITIAFRVWMSSASLIQGSGGIHIAPTLGEKNDIEKKYKFQWAQTIKGYIVEVVLPLMFILLAISIFLVNRNTQQTQSSKWFIAALVLLGLLRLNQAVYFWFQIESSHQSFIVGSVILRPLMLGCWLMAWRKWFDLDQSKWLPKIVAVLVLLYMITQLLGFPWISNSIVDKHFRTIAGDMRLLLLAIMLFTLYQGIRQQGIKTLMDFLVLLAIVLISIALFPQEVSALNIIPGIWFPYGVGVSRGQFFYAAFVLVMYMVLILRIRIFTR